jgi:hypothetical protein
MQVISSKSFFIFGFSVTEERTGYVSQIKQLVDESNLPLKVDQSAIGGASMKLVPFILNHTRFKESDYILLEISTCLRFAETKPIEYDEILYQIVAICRENNVFPCFVNLFRSNVNHSDDQLLQSVNNFAMRFGFPLLNLVPEIMHLSNGGLLDCILRDGIHTNDLGAKLYAGRILDFMLRIVAQGPSWDTHSYSPQVTSNGQRLYLPSALAQEEFERGWFRLPYAPVEEGSEILIDVPQGALVCGLMVLFGPRTGILSVSFPGKERSYRRIAYDQFCYYRRYSYFMFPPEQCDQVKIAQLSEMPDIPLKRGELDSSSRIGDICGLLLSSAS